LKKETTVKKEQKSILGRRMAMILPSQSPSEKNWWEMEMEM
jgi:hypothetical protein